MRVSMQAGAIQSQDPQALNPGRQVESPPPPPEVTHSVHFRTEADEARGRLKLGGLEPFRVRCLGFRV